MQTASTQDHIEGELQRSYAWGPDETALVNAIIGAAWVNHMSLRSGLRHTLSRLLSGMLFRGRRESQ